MRQISVLSYRFISDQVFTANVSLDGSISNTWTVQLNGTGPNGEYVRAKYLIADNSGNKGVAYVTLQNLTYTVAPFTRKNFTLPENIGAVGFIIASGMLGVTLSNVPVGVPDEVNQYAIQSGTAPAPKAHGFNSADKGADLVVSNSNLTVTQNVGIYEGIRSIDAYSAGKFYVEFVWINHANGSSFGVANSTYPTTGNQIWDTVNGAGIGGGLAQDILYNNASIATISPQVPLYGKMAIDFTLKKIWMAAQGQSLWNNNNGDPSAGTNGADITALMATGPLYLAASFNIVGQGITINTGGQPFNDIVPVGFTAGW